MARGIASAITSVGMGGGGAQTTTSPARSLREGVATAPLTVTAAFADLPGQLRPRHRPHLTRQEQVQALPGITRPGDELARGLLLYQMRERIWPRPEEQHVDQRAIVNGPS